MAVEQFANLAQTTLNGSITNIATTLTVTSATGFPVSGQFRIIIDSEIILVTAISGTTFTIARGAEGTTGAAHSSGVLVTHVVTAASLPNALNQNYVTTGGTSTAYTVTFSPVPTTYTTGPFFINFNATNTGAATLNPNSLGAKTIQYQGNALVAGQIITGTTYVVIYDGTNYQILGASPRPPVRSVFTTGSGTYTTPAGAKYLDVAAVGGGGGGAGGGTSPGAATGGGTSSFGSSLVSATGGSNAVTQTGGASGTASGGDVNISGTAGATVTSVVPPAGTNVGGAGGDSSFFCGGSFAGNSSPANSGGGGSGGSASATFLPGAGGGGGGSSQLLIVNPATSYSYAVGAGGSGGTAGTSGFAGNNGGSGIVIVTAYF